MSNIFHARSQYVMPGPDRTIQGNTLCLMLAFSKLNFLVIIRVNVVRYSQSTTSGNIFTLRASFKLTTTPP
ncbi:MAG: hypothetical protein JW936_01425 [Sedimentisphaerales bacterium]|nr:hypothetical protein [Sedimentisphaerales bacterium]